MRWNCPHCETSLAVSEEKLGTGWSFSKCYRCGGFALVRRAALSVIKVDRAPIGESVLMPEGADEQTKPVMLNATAQENYNQRIASRAAVQTAPQPPTPPPIPAEAAAAVAQANAQAALGPGFLTTEDDGQNLWTSRPMLMLAISATTVLAAGSGYYLFSEGQELWQKARVTSSKDSRQASREGRMRDSSEVLRPEETRILAQGEMTDEVRLQAMAPSRDSMIPPTAPISTGQWLPDAPAQAPSATGTAAVTAAPVAPTIAPAQIQMQAPPAASATSQSLPLSQSAAIPAPAPLPVGPQAPRAEVKNIPISPADLPSAAVQQPTPLVVRIRTNEARLHAGPGVQYPIIAMARPDVRYAVADWSDRWFKVAIRLPSGSTMAWIRNDQVLITPAGASETLPDSE